MRRRLFIVVVLGLALAGPPLTMGADPVVSPPVPERAEAPAPVAAPPAQIAIEKPKPAEKPKAAEKPKPAEKPRLTAENVQPPEAVPGKPMESSAPAADPAPIMADHDATKQSETGAGYSFGCLVLSFAMLILGIVAGFLGRHFLSRHKLGGMTVRIGTWRGIP